MAAKNLILVGLEWSGRQWERLRDLMEAAYRGEKKTELKKKKCNQCGTGWTDERTREDRASQSMDTGRLSFATCSHKKENN